MYGITDGVHRCLIAYHLGKRTIAACLDGPDDPPVEVPLCELHSPRPADTIIKGRLRECLELTQKGCTAPPIWAYPSSRATNLSCLAESTTIPELYQAVKETIEGIDKIEGR